MRIILLFLLCLSYTSSYTQQIKSSAQVYLDIKPGVTISEMIATGNIIYAVGQIRDGKELDAYLAKFTKEGEILVERRYGDSLVYDRATSIVEAADNYWVVLNQAIGNEKKVKLLEFDDNLHNLNSIDCSKHEVVNGLKVKKVAENELALLVDYHIEPGVSCPSVIKYDISTLKQSSFIFDQNNRTKLLSNYAFLYGLAGEAFQDTSKKLVKVPNNIDIVHGRIIALGSEDSGNFHDQWAGCINMGNQLQWDQFYEKEMDPGVDCLVNAMEASDGQVALVGQHYNKRDSLDYNYNYLLVDSSGKLLIEKRYSLGYDEIIVGGHQFGRNYLLYGYVNEEPHKEGYIGENIKNVNIWYVLIDERGNKVAEEYVQNLGFQTIRSSAKINENQFVSVFDQENTDRDGYYIVVTDLLSK